MNNKGFCC